MPNNPVSVDLADFLRTVGAKVDAEVVGDVVWNTLRDPAASPSDLVEALAVTLNPSGARVVADKDGPVEDEAARKVVAFLAKRGDIRIEGRRVRASEKFTAP